MVRTQSIRRKIDKSAWSLVFVNLLIVAWVLIGGVSFLSAAWIYLIQGTVIGTFAFVKMYKKGGPHGEQFLTLFFVVPYIIIHVFAFSFLGAITLNQVIVINGIDTQFFYEKPNLAVIIIGSLLFAANHLYSYLLHREEDEYPTFWKMLSVPYKRILPMYLMVIILMLSLTESKLALAAIVIAKGVFDVLGHMLKRYDKKIFPVAE